MYWIKLFQENKDPEDIERQVGDEIFAHVQDKIFQKNKDPKNLERQVGDKIFAHVQDEIFEKKRKTPKSRKASGG